MCAIVPIDAGHEISRMVRHLVPAAPGQCWPGHPAMFDRSRKSQVGTLFRRQFWPRSLCTPSQLEKPVPPFLLAELATYEVGRRVWCGCQTDTSVLCWANRLRLVAIKPHAERVRQPVDPGRKQYAVGVGERCGLEVTAFWIEVPGPRPMHDCPQRIDNAPIDGRRCCNVRLQCRDASPSQMRKSLKRVELLQKPCFPPWIVAICGATLERELLNCLFDVHELRSPNN